MSLDKDPRDINELEYLSTEVVVLPDVGSVVFRQNFWDNLRKVGVTAVVAVLGGQVFQWWDRDGETKGN